MLQNDSEKGTCRLFIVVLVLSKFDWIKCTVLVKWYLLKCYLTNYRRIVTVSFGHGRTMVLILTSCVYTYFICFFVLLQKSTIVDNYFFLCVYVKVILFNCFFCIRLLWSGFL